VVRINLILPLSGIPYAIRGYETVFKTSIKANEEVPCKPGRRWHYMVYFIPQADIENIHRMPPNESPAGGGILLVH